MEEAGHPQTINRSKDHSSMPCSHSVPGAYSENPLFYSLISKHVSLPSLVPPETALHKVARVTYLKCSVNTPILCWKLCTNILSSMEKKLNFLTQKMRSCSLSISSFTFVALYASHLTFYQILSCFYFSHIIQREIVSASQDCFKMMYLKNLTFASRKAFNKITFWKLIVQC